MVAATVHAHHDTRVSVSCTVRPVNIIVFHRVSVATVNGESTAVAELDGFARVVGRVGAAAGDNVVFEVAVLCVLAEADGP